MSDNTTTVKFEITVEVPKDDPRSTDPAWFADLCTGSLQEEWGYSASFSLPSPPPPELELVFGEPDEDGEREFDGLCCPYCGKLVQVVEVDAAERWNYADPDLDDSSDNPVLILAYGRGEGGDFQHVRYQCSACDRVVSLPKLKTDESWDF